MMFLVTGSQNGRLHSFGPHVCHVGHFVCHVGDIPSSVSSSGGETATFVVQIPIFPLFLVVKVSIAG